MRDEELRSVERSLALGSAVDATDLLRLERLAVSGNATAAELLRRVLLRLLECRGPETLRDVTPRSAPALLRLMRQLEGLPYQRAYFAFWDLTLALRNDADPQVSGPAVRGIQWLDASGRKALSSRLVGRRDETARAWREVLGEDSEW
jgi:hypothetical protein